VNEVAFVTQHSPSMTRVNPAKTQSRKVQRQAYILDQRFRIVNGRADFSNFIAEIHAPPRLAAADTDQSAHHAQPQAVQRIGQIEVEVVHCPVAIEVALVTTRLSASP
jgi:hypothetical protein